MFGAIQLEGLGLASSADTFSACFGSSFWRVHEICSSSVGGLAYLYFHLYNQTTNPTDRCCFRYLANFMSTVATLGPISVPSISSHGELNRQLFLFIPTDISDHGFSGGRAQNWPSIVACVTNSTQNSAIYKLRSGAADWLTRHCTSIVLCPPNSPSSSTIYKFTHGMQGWRGGDCHCLRILIPMKYLTESKILFSILNYLLVLTTGHRCGSDIIRSSDIIHSSMLQIMHSNYLLQSSAIYKLTTGFTSCIENFPDLQFHRRLLSPFSLFFFPCIMALIISMYIITP
jgi:hypothetical protein